MNINDLFENSGKKKVASNTTQLVNEAIEIVYEFAPSPEYGGGDDGFSEETLKQLAAEWWHGDADPEVERTLGAAGWTIGQIEDENGGVFVVQQGDINGNSYLSWPIDELEGLHEAQDAWHGNDAWHGEQTDEWHGPSTDRFHGQDNAWHMSESGKKPAVPGNERDPGAFATRNHIRDMEQKHTAWDQMQQELADEFYARHPELDDRNKTVDEDNDLAGALTGLNGVAAVQGSDNVVSPIGSGTVDEGRDDEVGFSVSSEQAYRAVMTRFGDSIEHRADGVMYAPRELWGRIEQVAFDADGVGAEEEAGLDMAEDQNAGGGGEPATDSTSPVGGGGSGMTEGDPKTNTRGDPHPERDFYFPVKDQWQEKLGPMGRPRKRKDVDVTEDIAEDIYESRLYKMKLAGYFD